MLITYSTFCILTPSSDQCMAKGRVTTSTLFHLLSSQKCLVLSNQNNQKPKDIKPRKTARPYIGEAATREFLTLLAKKGFERL